MKIKKFNISKSVKRKIFVFAVLAILTLVIELILSNITYLNVIFGENKNYVLTPFKYEVLSGSNTIEFDAPNIQIHNIKIYYENNDNNEIMQYTPVISVYGAEKEIRTLNTKFVIGNDNIKLNLNAENIVLRLNLNIENRGYNASIEKVVANDTSIEFSMLRYIVLLISIFIIYYIKLLIKKDIQYDSNNIKHKLSLVFMIIIILIISFYIIYLHAGKKELFYKDIGNYGRNFLNAQVEGIINKRASVLFEPSYELLQLSNPYDNSLRTDNALTTHVDYSLYNGKFYSYFGMAPVLLIMLPFKLITGYYISDFAVNSILFTILLFAIAKLYTMLINRYVKKLSLVNFILGFLTLIISTTMFIYLRGMAYDVVTVSAMLFTILTIIIILSIYNNSKNNKLVYLKMALCSLCMGLIVLSKPSFICYYLVLIYMLLGLRKILSKKVLIKSVIIFIIPITILGIFQMWWNYIRFDSIFEFGANYQLTATDMTNLTYLSPMKLFKVIMEYLFTMPIFDINNFPFFFMRSWKIDMELNTWAYSFNVVGILIIPICWIFLIYNSLKKKRIIDLELKKYTNMFLVSMIILLIINARNGAALGYIIDIKLFLHLFAIIIFFKLMEYYDNKIINKIFLIICIVSLVMTSSINFTYGMEYLDIVDEKFEIYLKNIFEFWL